MDNYKTLLDAARAETGLKDFGPDDFLEGLEILVTALDREANLTALGEQMMRQRIVGHLTQRLQIEDWYRRHPEIDEEEIREPLIGISLPRTGSTVLSFLLAADPEARSLRRLEAAQPCPPPCSQQADEKVDHDEAMRQATGWKPHVPSGDDAPAECQDLMALDFKSQIFIAFAQVPTYARWLLDADLTSTYQYQRRALKLLQWRLPEKSWRLKCPTHLIYLNDLDKAFPDARFVMTHRDPAEVMDSVIGVYADIIGKFTDHVDMQYITELNMHQWSEGLKRAMRFRDAGHDHRFYDIHFQAMHADPVGEVRRLYHWLGREVTDPFERNMACWWEANSAHRAARPPRPPAPAQGALSATDGPFAEYTRRMAVWTARQQP